jgi:hypothetical protein
LEGYDPAIGQEHGRSTAECEQFIVRRLGFLYFRNHLRKMKEAILGGFNTDIQKRIIAQSELLRKKLNEDVPMIADLVTLTSDIEKADCDMGDY